MADKPIKIEGRQDLLRLIDEGNRKVKKATRQAVYELTLQVARKADEFVPFDTGNLMRSQQVKFNERKIQGEITYGGTAAPYAATQHENTELWHPPKPPSRQKSGRKAQGTGPVVAPAGRGAKYLEHPVKMARKDFDKLIVNRVKALIR